MNQESKELWETILYKYIRGFRSLKERGIEITSIETYNNEFYIIYMKDSKSEVLKTKIPNTVIQHFLNTFKTSYSEIVLDTNLNFKTVITNYELYTKYLRQIGYEKQKLPKLVSTNRDSQKTKENRFQ